jgi:predicted nucleotidyltransferase
MTPLIERHLDAVRDLCRRLGVRRLGLFGSAATGAFRDEDSDLDFVVAFADTVSPGYADRYLDLAEGLEALFGRPVDLVTEASIRDATFRREVEATRQAIYADDRRDDQAVA